MAMEIEKQIVEYQKLEKQLQAIMAQRVQFEIQLQETENALKEVEKANSDVYKATGGIFIKTTKKDALEDLKERKEMVEIRIRSLKEQEEKLKSALTRLGTKIQEELKNARGGGGV